MINSRATVFVENLKPNDQFKSFKKFETEMDTFLVSNVTVHERQIYISKALLNYCYANRLKKYQSKSWYNSTLILVLFYVVNEWKCEVSDILTWISVKFPTIILNFCFVVSICPKFACVDNLDANVISRLPFSPRRAGINITNSVISSKTGQCWKTKKKT